MTLTWQRKNKGNSPLPLKYLCFEILLPTPSRSRLDGFLLLYTWKFYSRSKLTEVKLKDRKIKNKEMSKRGNLLPPQAKPSMGLWLPWSQIQYSAS